MPDEDRWLKADDSLDTSVPKERESEEIGPISWIPHRNWGNRDDPRFDYEFYLHNGGFATPRLTQ